MHDLQKTKSLFLKSICDQLPKNDGAIIRLSSAEMAYDIVCAYSHSRYKKDRHELNKQIEKAKKLIDRNEPGRRSKFVKKSDQLNQYYLFDEKLKQKTELLLGIKGYCTNIPEVILSNEKIIEHYHQLWRVEQTFRMSKTDSKGTAYFSPYA